MKNCKKLKIEFDEKSLLNFSKNNKTINAKNIDQNKFNTFFFIFYILVFIFIFLTCILIFLFKKQFKQNNNNNNLKNSLQNISIYNNNNDYNNNFSNINDIVNPYIKAQKDFCENNAKYINKKYENEIFLSAVNFNELKYQMYIFNSTNFILNEFKLYGAYEVPLSNNIIEALKFYASKYNISNNKDIFMLDIGSNVGWYPSLLGRYGYSILCFEAFEKNYYVAKKNYCHLNKDDENVIIITKGLGAKQKLCHYFNQINNAGNGMVICDDNKNILNDTGLEFIKDSDVEITTLDYFMPYLSNKNIAVMKIDVEGYELEVLKGGKELITKYHVPFVVLEFSPTYLKEVGSDPKELAQFFVDNGYKISLSSFLSKDFISVDELLIKAGFQVNCYFIHNSMT